MSGPQKPSLGRVVLVSAHPSRNNGADVAPAMITRVWSDTMVNVRVLCDSDEVEWRTSVEMVEQLDPANRSTWMWPPRV